MAEAVRAMVDSFAEPAPDGAQSTVDCRISAGSDEELVVAVLEEVIYRLEVFTEIPVATRLRPVEQGRWRVRFTMADAESATLVGAVPKAVSLHGLRFGRTGGSWSCVVTIDV